MEIAVSLFNEGIVTKEAALHMVTPEHLDIMLHPQFEDTESDEYKAAVIGEGLPASPGAVRRFLTHTRLRVNSLLTRNLPDDFTSRFANVDISSSILLVWCCIHSRLYSSFVVCFTGCRQDLLHA